MVDIQVIYLDTDNKIKFGFKNLKSLKKLSSAGLLLQKVIIRLMTLIGSNKMNPKFGSQFPNTVGLAGDESAIKASIVSSVLQIEREIKMEQTNQPYTTPRELLSSISIDGVSSDGRGNWEIALIINTMSNESFRLNL